MNPSMIQTCVFKPYASKPSKASRVIEHRSKNTYHICAVSQFLHPMQFTDIYDNLEEGKLYKAQDLGFAHPFWQKLRTKGLADAIKNLAINKWSVFFVDYGTEDSVKIIIDNKINENVDYLLVRITTSNGKTESHFFIGNVEPEVLEKVTSLLGVEFQNLTNYQAVLKFKSLMDYKLHHDLKWVGRWNSSESMGRKISLSNVCNLIQRARKAQPHLWCEGLPADIEFTERLSAFLMADRTMLPISISEKTNLVKATGLVEPNEMEGIYTNLKALQDEGKKWVFSKLSLPGLPGYWLEDEKKEGFEIHQERLWLLSRGKRSPYILEPAAPPDDQIQCPWPSWVPE